MEYEQNLELAEELFDEFLGEACELYHEIEKLDNEVRTPYRKIAALLDIDYKDVTDHYTSRFYDWANKVHVEVIDLVKSHDLYVKEVVNYWIVYPYDINDTLYNDDTDFNTLCGILTQSGGYYTWGEPWDLLEFNEYCGCIPEDYDVVAVFEEGLNNIKKLRQSKLKNVEKVCDELREQFSVDTLLADCERYVFGTED